MSVSVFANYKQKVFLWCTQICFLCFVFEITDICSYNIRTSIFITKIIFCSCLNITNLVRAEIGATLFSILACQSYIEKKKMLRYCNHHDYCLVLSLAAALLSACKNIKVITIKRQHLVVMVLLLIFKNWSS